MKGMKKTLKAFENSFENIIENVKKTTQEYSLELLSVVLYGSRARGVKSSDSDYDFLVLLNDDATLLDFTQFNAELRAKLRHNSNIEIFSNTPKNFGKILKNNIFLGAFCYIIASEGYPLYDPKDVFKKIQKKVRTLSKEKQLIYTERCLKMSKQMGRHKWIKYWKTVLKDLRQKS